MYRSMYRSMVLAALLSLSTLCLTGLSGCIYVPDVQQGNLISDEMIAKLKPGLSPQQVRFVLGTPLINDPFHKSRWDYVYTYRKGTEETVERRRLTIYFENDKLSRIQVEPVPAQSQEEEELRIEPRIYGKSVSSDISDTPLL